MSRGKHTVSRAPTGRVSWGVVGLVFGLMLAMSFPAMAGGSADKATGSGYWTNGGGDDFYAEFNVHEARDGRAAKGSLTQDRVDGLGGFVVDVTQVYVSADGLSVCFGGNTTDAWGEYAHQLNVFRWTTVVDGGEGSTDNSGDFLRGAWIPGGPVWCTQGDTSTNEAWSGGNVQIHIGKAHE